MAFAKDDEGVLREIVSNKEAKERGLKKYFTGRACKYGHVRERYVGACICVVCQAERTKKYREENKEQILKNAKKYREENKEQILENKKKYREENKEKIRNYREENKEQILEYAKKYREENKEQILEYMRKYYEENREYYLEYSKKYFWERYQDDPDFRLSRNIRAMLQRVLNATSQSKEVRTHEILGYSTEQLKESLESKFLEGMSWENREEWHIDHAYPVSRYIQDGVECPAIINALDNLIPMWDKDNSQKFTRTLEEYIEEFPIEGEKYRIFLDSVPDSL